MQQGDIRLVIPGEPVAKGRPRFYNGHTITPAKTLNYETLIKELYIAAGLPRMLDGELKIEMAAYFTIPKSASKKARERMQSGEVHPTKKPDVDNLLKVIDALNGIAWHDDSQVVQAKVAKHYADEPRMEITITQEARG